MTGTMDSSSGGTGNTATTTATPPTATPSSNPAKCSVVSCRRIAFGQPISKAAKKRGIKAGLSFREQMPLYVCQLHFDTVAKRTQKGGDAKPRRRSSTMANDRASAPKLAKLSLLEASTLKAYARRFALGNPTAKDDIVKRVERHFYQLPVNDLATILSFTNYARRERLQSLRSKHTGSEPLNTKNSSVHTPQPPKPPSIPSPAQAQPQQQRAQAQPQGTVPVGHVTTVSAVSDGNLQRQSMVSPGSTHGPPPANVKSSPQIQEQQRHQRGEPAAPSIQRTGHADADSTTRISEADAATSKNNANGAVRDESANAPSERQPLVQKASTTIVQDAAVDESHQSRQPHAIASDVDKKEAAKEAPLRGAGVDVVPSSHEPHGEGDVASKEPPVQENIASKPTTQTVADAEAEAEAEAVSGKAESKITAEAGEDASVPSISPAEKSNPPRVPAKEQRSETLSAPTTALVSSHESTQAQSSLSTAEASQGTPSERTGQLEGEKVAAVVAEEQAQSKSCSAEAPDSTSTHGSPSRIDASLLGNRPADAHPTHAATKPLQQGSDAERPSRKHKEHREHKEKKSPKSKKVGASLSDQEGGNDGRRSGLSSAPGQSHGSEGSDVKRAPLIMKIKLSRAGATSHASITTPTQASADDGVQQSVGRKERTGKERRRHHEREGDGKRQQSLERQSNGADKTLAKAAEQSRLEEEQPLKRAKTIAAARPQHPKDAE